MLVPHTKLVSFTAACLEKLGLDAADARLVADTLVAANLRGVDSHGVVRLPHYATRLRNGTVKARPRISARRTGPSAAIVEGDAGMGQLVAVRAMEEAISLAKQNGVGAVVARNSSHCGACAWFVEMAVNAGMIGIALTHTDPIMVPPGMKRIFLGSNPIAFGAPGSPPLIIDMSTTHAAWGKVLVARQDGKSIPPDWGVDQDGKPTTDPHQVVGLAPTGGHKGYALAAMVEILCAHLAGVPFGLHVTKMYGENDKPRNLGHFMLALEVARFTDASTFGAQIAAFAGEAHAEGGLAPGDPERRSAERRKREGIEIPEATLAELNALAAELGVAKLLNLIFDLGGVVVRWDPDAIIAGVFSDRDTQAKIKLDVFSHADWLEVDRGTLTSGEAVRRVARRTGIGEGELTKLVQAVPASLVPLTDTVDLLYRLKARGYPLYCLSNMGHASIEHLEREHRFFEVFSGKVISCRLKLCKPEPAIYQHALTTYRLKADETVFIDDVEKNVAAAAKLGIRTIQFKSAAQCEQELRALGVR